jgi:hypothetical protein
MSETMLTIAADRDDLGARIGITAVLHTWSSAMTHHPHIHMVVPGGGISLDGQRWISSRPAFLLPVPEPSETEELAPEPAPRPPCPCCGGRMVVIEVFERNAQPRAPPFAFPPSGMTPS